MGKGSFWLRPLCIQRAVGSLLLLLVLVGTTPGAQGCTESNCGAAKAAPAESRRVYDSLLAATEHGRRLLYADNVTGRIVWNEAQFMESLLNMYELTREARYLRIFVEHADHVLQARDDRARRPDFAGRLRPGWQTGGYYTLGVPATIPDDKGSPSLEVQAIHTAGNDHTSVEVVREDEEHFTLIVRNGFRRQEPLEQKYTGLTLATVEHAVNAELSPDSWVRIRVVGPLPPRAGVWRLGETYRMVLHELHTPVIGAPFLRFADLIFRNPELKSYQRKAEGYVRALEESYRDYAGSWREDSEGGYFVFEPGGKYWARGLPLPYNGLSANGRFLLWLWRVTGNQEYLERAAALARKVRAGMTFQPDGTVTMPYWVKGSVQYIGWKSNGTPLNDLYTKLEPDPAAEDVSHFSLTLRFMVEAWQMGIVFSEADLKAVAHTFTTRLWNPVHAGADELCNPDWRRGFYLAHNLDGKGRAYDYAAGTFALLSQWEPSILNRSLQVYQTRYTDGRCIDTDYLYGEVKLGWSVLALTSEGKRQALDFREKPLYPFTLRVTAEEYVKSSRLVSLDEHGIPVTDYGALHGGAGRRYNPTFIANYALALYRDYLRTGSPALLDQFWKQVNWFIEHKTHREYRGIEFWVWEFDFDNPTFQAKAPWISALSQGRVLCVFLAACDLTGDPQYLRAAELAFRSFTVPTAQGGVATFENGVAWYEEVADEGAPSSKILNGHIAAVQALWTFWKWTGRADVKRYLDLGIAAVRQDIALYDAGFLSYYSQYPTDPRQYAPAGDYNTLHVHQLLWLYEVTAEPLFLEYALRLARYDAPGWKITTAGSTDPVGHGPDNLFFQMYSRYWSHNQFPTWVELDLGKPESIEGVALFGYTQKSTPRHFRVLISEDGQRWQLALEEPANAEQFFVGRLQAVPARFVKIIILSDNGNQNVALTGVAVLRKHDIPMALCDWRSFSAGNLPAAVFGEGWRIPGEGWLVLDLGSEVPREVVLRLLDPGADHSVTILCSSDLYQWVSITPTFVQEAAGGWQARLNPCGMRYLKVKFTEECRGGRLLLMSAR